jgi:hypothetical protein
MTRVSFFHRQPDRQAAPQPAASPAAPVQAPQEGAYVAYFFGRTGAVEAVEGFSCPDDDTAKERVETLVSGGRVELWTGRRKVAVWDEQAAE